MAVINLNNMFPVPENTYSLKNPNTEKNQQYRTLLNNEIRIIKQKTEQISEVFFPAFSISAPATSFPLETQSQLDWEMLKI